MGKSLDTKKEKKKEPAKSAKEKKAEKIAKKAKGDKKFLEAAIQNVLSPLKKWLVGTPATADYRDRCPHRPPNKTTTHP